MAEKKVLKRIGVMSAAKMAAGIYAVMALIFGVIYFAITLVFSLFLGLVGGQGGIVAAIITAGIAFGSGVILAPIIGLVMGFIAGAIIAFVYNTATKFLGGIELEL